jgi:hypothetical protein
MKKFLLLPFYLLLITNILSAQKIAGELSLFRKKFPAEKIYIQYNKEQYTVGETIWFRAYLTNNHAPSGLSNNFYLQLTGNNGKVISNNKYPVIGAAVSGTIDIPDSVAGGNYTVKAFTPAMLNSNAGFIYTKKIQICNPATGKINNDTRQRLSSKISLHFFPEGGSLISGINTVIAFMAVDEFGYPVEAEGRILSDDSSMTVPFRSYHDGMGHFYFEPHAKIKYTAVTEVNGQVLTFALPPVQSSGMVLNVVDEKGGKVFKISRDKLQESNPDTFKVVARISDVIVYEGKFCFGDRLLAKGRIPTDSLQSGILQITVFNNDDAPVLERLAFVDNREYEAGTSLSVLKLETEPRGLNSLEFDFPDTAQRSCSMAVTDYQDDPAPNEENIISSLLLTSELKGKIFNPRYYFSDQSDSVRNAMDDLMLTHGWRRYNWKKILDHEYPEQKMMDEYLINIPGTVQNAKKTEVMSGGTLNIFIAAEDSSLLTYNYPVNKQGHFLLDSLLFSGSAKLYYSYTDANGKQKPVSVFLDEKKSPELPADLFYVNNENMISAVSDLSESVEKEKTSDARKITWIQKGFEKAKELENVNILSKAMRPVDILNEKYATGIFKTGSRYIIDNITRPEVLAGGGRGNVLRFIASRLHRVGLSGGGFFNITKGGSPIAIFINEFPAAYTELDQLRIEQIAIVKFWDTDPVVVASDYGGGTIVVYTKKYEDESAYKSKPPDAPYFLYNGYSIEKEFYSPDYSISPDKNKGRDLRTTLYWNPKLYTNAGENCIRVNFYNNDVSRKFKIVLEGIDNKGRLIFLEKKIGGGLEP